MDKYKVDRKIKAYKIKNFILMLCYVEKEDLSWFGVYRKYWENTYIPYMTN